MPACHAGGRGFEPLPRRQEEPACKGRFLFAQIAQSVEQGTENPRVVGSIPILSTKVIELYSMAFFILFLVYIIYVLL